MNKMFSYLQEQEFQYSYQAVVQQPHLAWQKKTSVKSKINKQ